MDKHSKDVMGITPPFEQIKVNIPVMVIFFFGYVQWDDLILRTS
jgi:hypothetical protein